MRAEDGSGHDPTPISALVRFRAFRRRFRNFGPRFLAPRKGLGDQALLDEVRESGFQVAIPCCLGYDPASKGVVHAGGVL